jgi:hypothetical protein
MEILRAWTPEEIARAKELIDNPPPGSAIEAAKQAGFDLYDNLYNLSLTPTERIHLLQQATDYLHFWGASYPRHPHLPGM